MALTEDKYLPLAQLYAGLKLSDLNGKYVSFRQLTASGDVYNNIYAGGFRGYSSAFSIKDGVAYAYELVDGALKQQKSPVAQLATAQVPVYDGKGNIQVDKVNKPVTKTVDTVQFIAFRGVNNPYDLAPNTREEPIIGTLGDEHAQAVGLLQALVLFLQSLDFFNFEPNKATEVMVLGHLHPNKENSAGTTSTSTSTSTTTAKPATTTTNTTTTTTAKPETTTTTTTTSSTTTTTTTTAKK